MRSLWLNTISTAIAQTHQTKPESVSTNTSQPKSTLIPTYTPTPKSTNTPRPTRTPISTSTSTPALEILVFDGSGDGVIDITDWKKPGILHITGPTVHDNFVVRNYNDNGEVIDLLVNTADNYEGYLPLNFSENEETTRLQVEVGRPWRIEILPIDLPFIHILEIPGVYEGKGDDVVFLDEAADIAKITSSEERGNFVVYSYSYISGVDLLVNEISPYSGTVVIPKESFVLTVRGPGNWIIEVSGR